MENEPVYENMEEAGVSTELDARTNPLVNVSNPIYESSNESERDGKVPEAQIRRRRDAPTPGTATKPTTSSEPVLGKASKKDDDIEKFSDALENQVTGGGKDVGSEPKITSSSGALTFDKLKGRENFDIWRVAAKSYLTIKGLWRVIEEEIGPDLWPITNARLTSEITLMIEPNLYNYIKETKSANEVWEGIVAAFDDKGTSRRVKILRQLNSVTLESGESMESYVNRAQLLWNKTTMAGFKISEDIVASIILGGLPSKYMPMILGVENSGHELTVDYVRNILLQNIPDDAMDDMGEKAMAVTRSMKSLSLNKAPKTNQKKRRRCYKCGDSYHIAIDCKKDVKCFRCGGSGHYAKSCKSPAKKVEKSLIVLVNHMEDERIDKEKWYVDSGATGHMCNNRDLFSEYRKIPGPRRCVAGIKNRRQRRKS